MRRQNLLLAKCVLAALPSLTAEAAGTPKWQLPFGDRARIRMDGQFASGTAYHAAQHAQVTTGIFSGAMRFAASTLVSAGGSDIYLAMIDTAGAVVWSKQFGDARDEYQPSAAVDKHGDILLTGLFQDSIDLGGGPLRSVGLWSEAFLAKLDANGGFIWNRAFFNAEPTGIATDSKDNVIVVGSFYGSIDFGCGAMVSAGLRSDAFIAGFNPDGSCRWNRQASGTRSTHAYAVAVDPSDNIVVTGSFEGEVDFGEKHYTSEAPGRFSAGYVVEMDSYGNYLWSQEIQTDEYIHAGALAVDAHGSVYVAGSFQGALRLGAKNVLSTNNRDVFLAKIDGVGTAVPGAAIWMRQYGSDNGTQWSIDKAISTDHLGNIYLAGTCAKGLRPVPSDCPRFEHNFFLSQLDPDGNDIWSGFYGHVATNGLSPAGGSPAMMALVDDGAGVDLYVAGSFSVALDFGLGSMKTGSTTDTDGVLVRIHF